MGHLDSHMEKNLVVNNKELEHKGIFRSREIFNQINKCLEEKGYVKKEKKSEELVTPAGRMLFLELRPYKVVTNYMTLMIKIKVTLDNVTDTLVEMNGKKEKFEKGDVLIAFDAWSMTDYRYRWGMKPWIYFLKGVINKFIYAFPLEAGLVNQVGSDTAYIYAQLRKLLISYKGERQKMLAEEEVKKKMAEEIKKTDEKEEK